MILSELFLPSSLQLSDQLVSVLLSSVSRQLTCFQFEWYVIFLSVTFPTLA